MSEQLDLFAPRAATSSSPPPAPPAPPAPLPLADPAGARRRVETVFRWMLGPPYPWRAAWTASAAWQSKAENERAHKAWERRVNRKASPDVKANWRADYEAHFAWMMARFEVGRASVLLCAPKRAEDVTRELVDEVARSVSLIADVPADAVSQIGRAHV